VLQEEDKENKVEVKLSIETQRRKTNNVP